MWCERTSQCYGDSDEGVTIHRMKKDKEVAYRGGDIGAGSWRRGRILTDGERSKGILERGSCLSRGQGLVWGYRAHHREDKQHLGVKEKTLESPLDCKEIKPVSLKGNQSWICITPILWPPDTKNCWKRLKAGEENDRGWDGWMASPVQWTGVWASSRSWWWSGKPGVLQSMGSQKVRHNWATKLNWGLKPRKLFFSPF